MRFYGIGNELEAAIAAMVPIGIGAWLGSKPGRSPRFAAWGFVIGALLAIVAFAPGRFGADVGAAIVLPAGAAVAAGIVLGLSRRTMLIALGVVAVGGVVALVLADAVLGGDSHLSRTVLGADNAGELGDVAWRRIRLTARSFYDPAYPYLLVVVLFVLFLGYRRRRQVLGWFGDRDAGPRRLPGRARGDDRRHDLQRLGRDPADHRHDLSGHCGRFLLGTFAGARRR